MKIKLKTLFLLSYMLMGIIAIVLSATAIYFIERLSDTPDKILKDNYGSILGAQNMINELDNMDNAVIIYVAGKKEKSFADSLYSIAKKRYFENYELCRGNITEPGEKELVDTIRSLSETYIRAFDDRSAVKNINDYDSLISPRYSSLKGKSYELLNLNHKGMLLRRDSAVKISESAEIYMLVISILSIIIVIIAMVRVPSLVVNPVLEFTAKVRAIADKKYSERIEVNSKNELGELAVSFNAMASRLEEYEQTSIDRLIAEKKRAEAIVRNMVDGILVLDENDNVILINNTCVELIGNSPEAITGRNVHDLAGHSNLLKNLVEDLAGNDPKQNTKLNYLRIVFREKEEFFMKEIVPVTDETDPKKKLGHIIILKNVTGFKQLDELKSGFVATVSHELRTPLSAMNMSLRLLQDERIGSMNEEQLRITGTMKEEVKRLLKLVNELLDLSRIESGSDILKYQSAKADELIDAAITPMLLQLEQKDITLETDIEKGLPELKIDANKIAWVLINLLNNAVRYSKEGGKILLAVKKAGSKVQFSVRDFGKGIEPQYLSRIFDKFVQVNSKNIESLNKGVGLGLAISKEFVNAHGGDIWVKSELDKGSEFFFTIPF